MPDPEQPDPSPPPAAVGQPLADRLILVRPRERAGARMTARVNYQQRWALCEILRRHETGNDYCFVFEFHDDVVILDSPTNPSTIRFCQVKTRTDRQGNWTLRRLMAADRGEEGEDSEVGLSILGKLFSNQRNFPGETDALVLVSNAPFRLDLRDGETADREDLPITVVADNHRQEIVTHLQAALGGSVSVSETDRFVFTHCSLSLRDADAHALGRLQEFLDRSFPGRRPRVSAIFKVLLAEIATRSGNEDAPASFQDVVSRQGLSRDDIDRHLRAMATHDDPEAELEDIVRRLDRAGWSWPRIRHTRAAWTDYEVQIMDPTNLQGQEIQTLLIPIVERVLDAQPHLDPADIVAQVVGQLSGTSARLPVTVGTPFCDAAILFEAMRYHARKQPTPPDSPSAEEAA